MPEALASDVGDPERRELRRLGRAPVRPGRRRRAVRAGRGAQQAGATRRFSCPTCRANARRTTIRNAQGVLFGLTHETDAAAHRAGGAGRRRLRVSRRHGCAAGERRQDRIDLGDRRRRAFGLLGPDLELRAAPAADLPRQRRGRAGLWRRAAGAHGRREGQRSRMCARRRRFCTWPNPTIALPICTRNSMRPLSRPVPKSQRPISGDTHLEPLIFRRHRPDRLRRAAFQNPLAYRYYDKNRVVLGKTMEAAAAHGRVLLAHASTGTASMCSAPARSIVPGTAARSIRPRRTTSSTKRSSSSRGLGLPYFCFHDVDVMAQAHNIREHVANFLHIVDKIEAQDGGDRRQTAVGHGESVQPSALHGGRRHQSRSRGVPLRRHAGAPLPRGDAPPGRRELRAVGRARRLRHAAQHQPEAGKEPARPVPLHGGGTQAQDRLQGR